MFKKFSRGSAGERTSVPGSGLGLYICRSIVEAHDGRIWIDSTVGEGTTVGVWLPHEPRTLRARDAGVLQSTV